MSTLASAEGFVKLGEHVYLRQPSTTALLDDGTSPQIILVFGWMGANIRHIHKYTKVYEEIYPTAVQVLIANPSWWWWVPDWRRRQLLAPAIRILQSLGAVPNSGSLPTSEPYPRILSHVFSNGGSYTLTVLGDTLSSYFPSRPKNVTSALILDSTPGRGGIQRAITIFAFGLGMGTLKKYLFAAFFSAFAFVRWSLTPILRRPFSPERLRLWLYRPDALPWMSKDTPRLYVYSLSDAMVDCSDVKEHVEGCKKLGYPVEELRFEDTPHVAHVRAHPETYWEAVKKVWSSAVSFARQ